MVDVGLKVYCFFIVWICIFLNGKGEVNEVGLKFYDNLIDELFKYDIELFVMFYYWDIL